MKVRMPAPGRGGKRERRQTKAESGKRKHPFSRQKAQKMQKKIGGWGKIAGFGILSLL
jgi:hypothetical protein